MARPRDENNRLPVTGPHLRYVKQYTTDEDPYQPVQVKLLKWNGSAFVVYGGAFRIGEAGTAGEITDGQQFWVVWKSDALRWMPIGGGSSSDKYTIIQGLTTAAVTADLTSFTIDNIELLANSLDPRMTPGDMAETLSIANSQAENFADNEMVLAIYDAALDNWRTLVVERFRAIRGDWYSGTTTLSVKAIVALDSGLDPRTDPTDVDEIVSVENIASDAYGSGDKVWADYNAKDGVWEARPKGGGGDGGRWGTITHAGSPGTPDSPTNDCEVTLGAGFGGTVLTAVLNYSPDLAPYGKAARVSGSDVSATLDWWSCNPV